MKELLELIGKAIKAIIAMFKSKDQKEQDKSEGELATTLQDILDSQKGDEKND